MSKFNFVFRVYQRLIKLFGPYKKIAFISFGAIIISASLEVVCLGILSPLFSIASNQKYIVDGYSFLSWINFLTYEKKLILFSLTTILLYFFRSLTLVFREYCIAHLTNGLIHFWSLTTFDNFLSNKLIKSKEKKIGYVINSVITEPMYAAKALRAIIDILSALFSVLGIFFLLYLVNKLLTIYIFLTLITISFLSISISKVYSQNIGKQRICIQKSISQIVSEAVTGLRQIKVFSIERKALEDINMHYSNLIELMKKYAVFSNAPKAIGEFIVIAFIVSAICLGSFSININLFTHTSEIGVFGIALIRIFSIGSLIVSKKIEAETYFTSINGLNIKRVSSYSKQESKPQAIPNAKIKIDIENLCFAYDPQKPILNNINLKLKYGEIVALSGASGSGKTTFCDILVKLLSPTNGGIYVNGIPLKSINDNKWRKKLGYVSQDPFIFYGTVKDNIKIGSPKASNIDVIKAASHSQAHDFIISLPEGYNTFIGTGGYGLSGGQRQRIALAQALLKRPDLLILDEATSGLDIKTEKLIFKAIKKEFRQKIVLLITHRTETLKYANVVNYIEKGKFLTKS